MNPNHIQISARVCVLLIVFQFFCFNGLAQCISGDETVDITADLTYSGSHYLSKRLYIIHANTTVTMDAANIQFAQGSCIRVDQFAKLIIRNGSVLSSYCSEAWGGIEVVGDSTMPASVSMQGYVEISGSVIKNAECGIRAHQGGLVNMMNSQFVDNINSLTIDGCYKAYPFVFLECDFNWIDYNMAGYGQQVKLTNMNEVSFLGCRFKTVSHNQGIAIQSNNSSLIVTASGTVISGTYPVKTTGRRPAFEGFYNAIELNAFNNFFRISLTDFLNNIQSIRSSGNMLTQIFGNTFTTNNGAPQDPYQGFYVPIKDIYIYHSSSATVVANNDFTLSRSEGFLPPLNYIPCHITFDACSFPINILKNHFTSTDGEGWDIVPVVIQHHTTIPVNTSSTYANIYCNQFDGYRNDMLFKQSIGFNMGYAHAPANNRFSLNTDDYTPFNSIMAVESGAIDYYKENASPDSRMEPLNNTNVFVSNSELGMTRNCKRGAFDGAGCAECITLSNGMERMQERNREMVLAKNTDAVNTYTLLSPANNKENTIELFSLTGTSVYAATINMGQTIQLNNLQKGLYLYRISEQETIVKTGKLIVE